MVYQCQTVHYKVNIGTSENSSGQNFGTLLGTIQEGDSFHADQIVVKTDFLNDF